MSVWPAAIQGGRAGAAVTLRSGWGPQVRAEQMSPLWPPFSPMAVPAGREKEFLNHRDAGAGGGRKPQTPLQLQLPWARETRGDPNGFWDLPPVKQHGAPQERRDMAPGLRHKGCTLTPQCQPDCCQLSCTGWWWHLPPSSPGCLLPRNCSNQTYKCHPLNATLE